MRSIDADALIYNIEKIMELWQVSPSNMNISAETLILYLKSMPVIDPVKHGHWIKMGELDGEINGYKATVVHNQCSSCLSMTMSAFVAFRPTYKYCPYCGANMDEMDYEVSEC